MTLGQIIERGRSEEGNMKVKSVIGVIIGGGLLGGIVYVACHFLSKCW